MLYLPFNNPQKGKNMHFDFDAYEKVFPEQSAAKPVETVVETFKPTEEMAKDNKPGDEKAVEIPAADPADDPEPEITPAGEPPKGELENG